MISRNFYYELLNDNQKRAYNSMLSAIQARQSSVNIGTNITPVEFNDVIRFISMEHPEYAYFAGVYCSLDSAGNINIPYLDIDENLYTTKVNYVVNEIYLKTHGSSSKRKIVQAIFDYLTEHLEYDYEIYRQYANADNEGDQAVYNFAKDQAISFTPYAVFVNNKAVCMGIAKAFKILCDLYQIDCQCIRGAARLENDERGIEHMLNRVSIDGVESYVDVTNGLKTKSMPMVQHRFYLCSQEDVHQAYILDDDYSGVRSIDNYFNKYNCSFKDAYYLRNFLASYDATSHQHKIEFNYIGDDIEKDKVADFAVEILNKYVSGEKQWVGQFEFTFFCAMLLDSYEIKKLQAMNKN